MIRLQVTNLAPLHLSDGYVTGPMATTLPYIPGQALQGALAKHWQESYGPNDDTFARLFLSPNNWYGPLLPAPTGQEGKRETFILPQTAFTCKRYPGFLNLKALTRDRHGVQDRLFALLGANAGLNEEQCTQCHSALQPVNNRLYTIHGRQHLSVEPDKRLITRTALDSQRETAARRQLFTQEVIGEGHYFTGFIQLTNTADEDLLVQHTLQEGFRFWVGGAKTRGQGEVEVKLVSQDIPSELHAGKQSLTERITAFDAQARNAGIICQHKTFFTLDLLTDTIIRDAYLRFDRTITPVYLGQYLHPDLQQAELLINFCQTRLVDGWHMTQRLPRETSLVITAGSVFAYGIDLSPAELAQRLEPLERWGIGSHQPEGFGRITINHPFHLNQEAV